jgi:hypothetical protein
MICSEPKLDSHRFKDIIDEAIAEGKTLSCRCCSVFSIIMDQFHSVPLIQQCQLIALFMHV